MKKNREIKKLEKELKIIKDYKKLLQKSFGDNVCRELNVDCSSCKAQILIGFVNWHIEAVEWTLDCGKGKDKLVIKKKIKHEK